MKNALEGQEGRQENQSWGSTAQPEWGDDGGLTRSSGYAAVGEVVGDKLQNLMMTQRRQRSEAKYPGM